MKLTYNVRIYPESFDLDDELWNLMQDDGLQETISASISRILYGWMKHRDIEIIVKYHHAMQIREKSNESN